jgi:hypothetical protein
MEPEGSLPHSEQPATCPYPNQSISSSPRFCEMFRNIVNLYGEVLLAPRSTPKLKDHPLSAVRDWLFNTFASTLHIWRPFLHSQPEDAPRCGDRDPLITDPNTKLYINSVLKRRL